MRATGVLPFCSGGGPGGAWLGEGESKRAGTRRLWLAECRVRCPSAAIALSAPEATPSRDARAPGPCNSRPSASRPQAPLGAPRAVSLSPSRVSDERSAQHQILARHRLRPPFVAATETRSPRSATNLPSVCRFWRLSRHKDKSARVLAWLIERRSAAAHGSWAQSRCWRWRLHAVR
jgi:hypothetical protein